MKGKNFPPEVWSEIVKEFFEETGCDYDYEQLYGKFKRMKLQYGHLCDLVVRQTGLGWDATTGVVLASKAQKAAWLSAHPGDGHLLMRPFAHFDYCHEMFKGYYANGDAGQSNRAPPRGMDSAQRRTQRTDPRSAGPSNVRVEDLRDEFDGPHGTSTMNEDYTSSPSMQNRSGDPRRRRGEVSVNEEFTRRIEGQIQRG
ncbi:uncharacterized protein LOC127244460 [Andrographis paniculata]|uniref:uncharacterized protein LOC127244460 n=1 Tax=Andrographis paniculata TaxID=175694 RepID=UPI0021E732A5|nr:uncharacterized protein LOC127244460 [Andrographis paniculata]